MEEDLWWGYCDFSGGFGVVLKHLYQFHDDLQMKYRIKGVCKYTGKNLLFSKLVRYKYPKDIPFDQLNINVENKTLTI